MTEWRRRGQGKKKTYRCHECGGYFEARRFAWLCSPKCRKVAERIRRKVAELVPGSNPVTNLVD